MIPNSHTRKNKILTYLVGAGLAEFDGVRGLDNVLPNAEIPSFPVTFVIVEPVTDKRDGRCELVPPPPGVVEPPSLRCGILVGVASSEKKI